MTFSMLLAATSTTAGVVTAITAVVGLLTASITLVVVARPALRTLNGVHEIVNQQRTDMQRYQVALIEALRAHGIDVPIDQSLPVTGHRDADGGALP